MTKAIFIPIKEKSQRVPRKNFRKLGDTELWKINVLKFSQGDIPVYVDTDSNRILEECRDIPNVQAYRRKSHLLGHEISVNDLLAYFVHTFGAYETICQVHVTSPFLRLATVLNAFEWIEQGFDSVIGCNVHQARFWRLEDYGYCPVNHNPMRLEETQGLPKLYEENSSLYTFTANGFKRHGKRVGVYPYFLEVPFPECLDIDDESDWAKVVKLGEVYEHYRAIL